MGIHFVEGIPDNLQKIKPIHTRLDGIFTSAQLKTLDDIKKIMVVECEKAGGNAIVDFKYVQKSRHWLSSMISRDDMLWEASGIIATLVE